MSSTEKELVRSFYTSDFYKKPEEIKTYLHPEAELYWNSSAGFNKMNYDDICEMTKGMSKSFDSLRAEISHLLVDGDDVTIRFTYHIRTVENSEEEIPLGHFIAIWKIKDGKMYKGYQISQPADESPENLGSFIETNF
jgi:hypothetical protein